MARVTLEAFESQVATACAAAPLVISLSVQATGVTWIHLRAYLSEEMFIDTFYNEATGRTSFALIKNAQRIFGADNTGGWHWHPFETPDEHSIAPEPIAFEAFLEQVEKRLAGV